MSRSGLTVAVEAALSRPLEDCARYAGLGGARPAPCRGARRRGRCVLRACREAALGWLLVAALGVCRSRRRWTTRLGTALVEAALGRFLVAALGVPVATAA